MKIYSSICPCKGCENRASGCHSKCDKYSQWQKDYKKTPEKWVSNSKVKNYYNSIRKHSKY